MVETDDTAEHRYWLAWQHEKKARAAAEERLADLQQRFDELQWTEATRDTPRPARTLREVNALGPDEYAKWRQANPAGMQMLLDAQPRGSGGLWSKMPWLRSAR